MLEDVYHRDIETAEDFDAAVEMVRDRPLCKQISSELDLSPNDPETWRSPQDATAREFDSWDADRAD